MLPDETDTDTEFIPVCAKGHPLITSSGFLGIPFCGTCLEPDIDSINAFTIALSWLKRNPAHDGIDINFVSVTMCDLSFVGSLFCPPITDEIGEFPHAMWQIDFTSAADDEHVISVFAVKRSKDTIIFEDVYEHCQICGAYLCYGEGDCRNCELQ